MLFYLMTSHVLKLRFRDHHHPWMDEYGFRMIMMAKLLYSGLELPDICLTGVENPRKKLTHETCPDRGSYPGPLSDRRACYRLLHSGGPF